MNLSFIAAYVYIMNNMYNIYVVQLIYKVF